MKIATGPTRRQGLRRLAVLTAGSGAASVLGAVGIVFVLPGTTHHATTTSGTTGRESTTTTTPSTQSQSKQSNQSTNSAPTVTSQGPVATSGGS